MVGAVAYTPNVVPIWEGIRDYFADGAGRDGLRAVLQLRPAGRRRCSPAHIDIAWNTNLAWVRTVLQTDGGCRALAHARHRPDVHHRVRRPSRQRAARPGRPQGPAAGAGLPRLGPGRDPAGALPAPGRARRVATSSCCASTATSASTATPAAASSTRSGPCWTSGPTPPRSASPPGRRSAATS